MKKNIMIKLAAIIAFGFSLLTIVEGTQVLLGISKPGYIILSPLLYYNVIMGFVGILVGTAVWVNYKKQMTLIKIVLTAHFFVLILITGIYFIASTVSMHSIQAMIIRVAVWLVIYFMVWKYK
jgi:hypothetical protein